MNRLARSPRFYMSLAGVFIAAGGVFAVLAFTADESQSPSKQPPDASRPTYSVSGDHPTYATLDALAARSTTVVTAKIVSSSVAPGQSPGTDEDGRAIPGIPSTEWRAAVEAVFKGDARLASRTIVVAIAGGETQTASFVAEGGAALVTGETYLFFLGDGDNGTYYALAGDTAIGSRQADGSFLVPAEATGGQPLRVTGSQLAMIAFTPPGSSGSTPPGSSGSSDKTAPVLTLSGARRQSIGKLFVRVKSSERATALATATVKVKHSGKVKTYPFRAVVKAVVANTKARLRLKLKSKHLRAIKRALRHGQAVRVKVRVLARDAAGNVSSAKRTVRLKG